MAQTSDIEKLINQGRFFEARIIADKVLEGSDDLRMRQLLALSMSKSGMSEPARDLLEPVHQLNSTDPETAGILGSIYKRLFKKTQDNKYAVQARTTYQQNFAVTQNYYTGINAASMAIISGKGSEGRALAQQVIALLQPASENFWEQATLGEAYLLTRDKASATQHYLIARKLASKEWGKIQSVYDQLLLLNFFISVPSDILKAFAPPGIIAFTGHMIDQPGRKVPRFPASAEHAVKQAIASAIRTIRASIGYCSLSCGADILFAEAMAEAGGELHLFLPFNREDYIRESVQFAGHGWVERFERLEKMFPVTYVTHEHYAGNDDLFSFQNRVILGTVTLHAAMNFTTPTLLSVLSETDLRQKEGGTRDTLAMWPYRDHQININPDNFIEERTTEFSDVPRAAPTNEKKSGRHIFYLVMADLPGASQFELDTFRKFLSEVNDRLLLKPQFAEVSEQIVAAFPLPTSAMELVRAILSYRKLGSILMPRISLHAIPIQADGTSIHADDLISVRQLHQVTPPGIPSAYGWFAAATTLTSDNWVVEFAGVVGKEAQPATEVYSVRFKK